MPTQGESGANHLLGFLKNQTFFGGLPDKALESLARRGHVRAFPKGTVIYRCGEPGGSLMVIVSGRIKIANTSPDGKEVVLNFLGPGDINGEIAVLDGRERTANAIALEDTKVLSIYARDVIPALTAHPEALLEITRMLCEKLRVASAIVEDSTREMRSRAARGLLRLAQQHGRVTKHGIRIDLVLSQHDLGNYLNVSRANVSRELRHLKDANVIMLDGEHILIIDERGLSDIAESAVEG